MITDEVSNREAGVVLHDDVERPDKSVCDMVWEMLSYLKDLIQRNVLKMRIADHGV